MLATSLDALVRTERMSEFWVVRGQQNILTQTRAMISDAHTMLDLVLPTDCDVAESLAQARARGCRIVHAAPEGKDVRALLLVCDGRKALLGTMTPLDSCQAIVSSNTALLDTLRGYFLYRQSPASQQSVDIALSEYAPGRELIVDKATYRVGGIYIDPFWGASLATRVPSFFKQPCQTFALCTKCSYTLQIQNQQDSPTEQQCPLCHAPLLIQEILEPPGYAPEGARSLEQSQMRNDGSRNGGLMPVQLVLPQSQTDTFKHGLADQRIAWSNTEHHQLLIMNTGGEGQGFSMCRSCGAGAAADPAWLQQGHDRPFLLPGWMNASKKCNAAEGIWQGYLGHVFYSDLFLLRLL